MALAGFSKYAECHPNVDRMIDRRTADAARNDKVLIDARLAGWMAKKADVKILLVAPLKVRAKRIAQREKRKLKEVMRETVARERSEIKRFQKFYAIDVNDHSPFDLVLNTGRLSIREMARILETTIAIAMKRRS